MSRSADREVRERASLVDTLTVDVHRQLESAEGRSRDLLTRGSLLIAASSLLAALTSPDIPQGAWYVAAAVSAALAALSGVAILLPRFSSEIDLEHEEAELWHTDGGVARREMLHRKIAVLDDINRSLVWRAWVLSAGFALLSISVISLGVALIWR